MKKPFYCSYCIVTREYTRDGLQQWKAHKKTKTHWNNQQEGIRYELTPSEVHFLHSKCGHHYTLAPYNKRAYRIELIEKERAKKIILRK